MMDFNLIGEMTKDEMIEEILAHQRRILEGMEPVNLKGTIVDIRVGALRERLTKEAGITVTCGIFGAQVEETDDNG